MRVIHVITRLVAGGAQENTASSVLGLQQKPGLQVSLVSGLTAGTEGSLVKSFQDSGGRLTLQPKLVRPVHPWKDILAWRGLTRLFQSERPDIVHTHSGKAGVLGRLAASHAQVPTIVHTIHGPSFGAFQGVVANSIFRSAERRAGKVTDHFVVVAQAMREQYLAAGIGEMDRYSVIHSGFDMAPFLTAKNDPNLRSKWGIHPNDLVVCKIARLFKLKGHDDLLDIAPTLVKANPRIKFLIIGAGPWKERLVQRAQELGLEKQVIFTGLVPASEIPKWLGIIDVLAHFSSREGLARALPQALAAGKPIVAYNCDGAGEVCKDGETGYLVPVGDSKIAADRISKLVAEPSLRERFGRQGRELVRASFTVEKMVDDLYGLYLKLIKSRPSPS